MKKILVLLLGIVLCFAFYENVKGETISNNYIGIYKNTSSIVPDDIRGYANICELEYGVNAELLMAIAWHESRYKSEVISKNGKFYGLMQIHPGSHKERISRLNASDLLNPYNNMRVAADYLSELMEDGDTITALIGYHGEGEGALKRYLTSGKTSSYVKEILDMTNMLKEMHGRT